MFRAHTRQFKPVWKSHFTEPTRRAFRPSESVPASGGDSTAVDSSIDAPALELKKPIEPGCEDCCRGGCRECVWDIYFRELQAYEKELARREGRPPPLDPFEELEKRLAGKS